MTKLVLAGCGVVWLIWPRAGDAADTAERRQRVVNMSAEEQQAIAHKQERFAALSPQEQDKLRALDQALAADPQADELRETMTRYYDWLRGLTPGQRAELLELAPADRLERIKKIKAEQERRTGGLLPTADRRRFFRWLEELSLEHEQELMDSLPKAWRERMLKMTPNQRRQALIWTAWQKWRTAAPDEPGAVLTLERLADVLPRLSEATRRHLNDLKTPEEAHELLLAYVGEALMFSRARPARQLPDVSQEDLERFFKNDLKQWQRDHLMELPREQMQRELKWLYFQSAQRQPGDGRRGDPPRGPGPEFPPRGPDERRGPPPAPPRDTPPRSSG